MKLYSHSLEDTRQLAEKMAELLKEKTITITLDGDLGAGKTTFTQFFGKALGVKRTINSPTFNILKSYHTEDGRTLYHMDAYRLEGAHQDLGFEEIFEDGICVVEWSDYIVEQIPSDHIALVLKETADGEREIEMNGTGPESCAVVEEFA